MAASYMLATRKSAYHDSCVPADKRQAQTQVTQEGNKPELSKNNHVAQDQTWKQCVDTEKRCLKNWEENWGFLTEFDAQGNIKEKPPLPEKLTVFSDDVPNTNSGNYGNRVKTELGITMQQLEYRFYSDGRRRKMGGDMICY